jgi:hypothetical protein
MATNLTATALEAVVSEFDQRLAGQRIDGIVGGANWLSLRVEAGFVWLSTLDPLRSAWIDPKPLPKGWLLALGSHSKSPFQAHLKGETIGNVRILASADRDGEGILLEAASGAWQLGLRWHPRPGAIWLRAGDELLAQQGRMGGEQLEARIADSEGSADASHAENCRENLGEWIFVRARERLQQILRGEAKRRHRLLLAMESDLERARRSLKLRGQADALASVLHSIRPGQDEVELVGFDGIAFVCNLNPARSPAENLDRLYRRAAKAERSVTSIEERLEATLEADRIASELEAEFESCSELDPLLDLAARMGVQPGPRQRGEQKSSRKASAPRLPYRAYRLDTGSRLLVGKSARDNDEMLRRHARGKDLWLHAQGVEGSHVLLRSDRDATAKEIDIAAAVAAHFSKAKHSSIVPVIVTERRYVRKPRKSAPGSVVAERAKTVFVAPQLDPDVAKREAEED